MKNQEDVLFGKIAIKLGLVTQEQVEECVRIQEKLPNEKPLGQIMLERNYIEQEELEKIVEQQRENMKEKGRITRRLREDQLYGQLVKNFGFASEEEVNECVRMQANLQEQENEVIPLGKILLRQEVITEEEHRTVLDFQENNILNCPVCENTFNVVMYNAGSTLECYKCKEGSVTVPETE